jgi:sulfide dehydrogenase cytochrome subunit
VSRADRAAEFALPPVFRDHRIMLTRAALAVLLTISPVAAFAASAPPPGAAACSGCHPAGTKVDSPVPRLAGRSAADIAAAMKAFRSGERSGTVMGRIAKGFSDDEVQAIAAWYAAQP